MSFYTGRFTISSTGLQTFTLGSFQPAWAILRSAGVNVRIQFCEGALDGTRQNCESFYSDGSGSQGFDTNTKCLSMYDRVSGSITEVLSASFSSFGISSGTGNITLNVSLANPNYKVTIECGD